MTPASEDEMRKAMPRSHGVIARMDRQCHAQVVQRNRRIGERGSAITQMGHRDLVPRQNSDIDAGVQAPRIGPVNAWPASDLALAKK